MSAVAPAPLPSKPSTTFHASCAMCASECDARAVFTSCKHFLCGRCMSKYGTGTICPRGCAHGRPFRTVSLYGPATARIQAQVSADPAKMFAQATVTYEFQRQQDALTLARLKELVTLFNGQHRETVAKLRMSESLVTQLRKELKEKEETIDRQAKELNALHRHRDESQSRRNHHPSHRSVPPPPPQPGGGSRHGAAYPGVVMEPPGGHHHDMQGRSSVSVVNDIRQSSVTSSAGSMSMFNNIFPSSAADAYSHNNKRYRESEHQPSMPPPSRPIGSAVPPPSATPQPTVPPFTSFSSSRGGGVRSTTHHLVNGRSSVGDWSGSRGDPQKGFQLATPAITLRAHSSSDQHNCDGTGGSSGSLNNRNSHCVDNAVINGMGKSGNGPLASTKQRPVLKSLLGTVPNPSGARLGP